MRLVTNSKQLNTEFAELLARHKRVSIAVAWASASEEFEAYQLFLRSRRKIKKCVVGLHFFQTHPNFIKKFSEDERVRFVKQPDGVFHPKLYLFETSPTDWACLLGSANLTQAAFSLNSEACMLFTSEDDPNGAIKSDLDSILDDYWEAAEDFEPDEFEAYKKKWKLFRGRMRPIVGDFGKGKRGTSILKTHILNMPWRDYFESILSKDPDGLDKRLAVLKEARRLFEKYEHLSKMPDASRLGVAGLRNEKGLPWGWFGWMGRAWMFRPAVIDNNEYISKSLDFIPFEGEVTRSHYDEFILTYVKAFPGGGHGLATATRLLAMKRPDHFMCLSSANSQQLCKAFDVSIRDYEDYWDKVVQRIMIADWFASPRPRNRQQAQVWDGRVAFLDSILYEPPS